MNSSYIHESSIGKTSRSIFDEQFGTDLDPMLEKGSFHVAFHQEVPIQVRKIDEEGKQYGTRQMQNIRIMAEPDIDNYHEIKIQLSSESDLYSVLECRIDMPKFQKIRKSQSLNFDFTNMLAMLIKQLTLCGKMPEQYSTVLYYGRSSETMTIFQNIEYKKIELLTLKFSALSPEELRQYLSYRFIMLKEKNEKLESATQLMLSMVKLKNPNLLQTMMKKIPYQTLKNTVNDLNTSTNYRTSSK